MSAWFAIAEGLQPVLGMALLFIAGLVFWRRAGGKLFLAAAAGFLLALLGHLYRNFVLAYAEVVCESGEGLARFLDCANQHATFGAALAGLGLLVAGIALLLRALSRRVVGM